MNKDPKYAVITVIDYEGNRRRATIPMPKRKYKKVFTKTERVGDNIYCQLFSDKTKQPISEKVLCLKE